MIKKIVISNGKKYMVNTAGWNDDVGPGAPMGTLWMISTDGKWYAVTLTGTSGSAAVAINQTPLGWQAPSIGQDLGYQLLQHVNGNVYQVYLTGNAGAVTMNVNQTPWTNPLDYKTSLFLKSVTDSCFYNVYVSGGGPIVLSVNQNTKTNLNQPGLSPFVTGSWNRPYSPYN